MRVMILNCNGSITGERSGGENAMREVLQTAGEFGPQVLQRGRLIEL